MSPLFGGTKKPDDETAAGGGAEAEIARIRSLSPSQIAAEVIARGFDLGDTVDRGRASVHDMAARMVPDFIRQSQDEIWELEELIGEGVQLLALAALVQCTIVGADRRLQWVLTRRGRSAVAEGSIPAALAKVE